MIKDFLYRMAGLNPLSQDQIREGLTRGVEEENDNRENDNDNDDSSKIITSFVFMIDASGRLFINGSWIESSDVMADIISQFFYLLNAGELKSHIAQYFLNSQELVESIEQKRFLNEIMSKWAEKIKKEEDKENEPIIKPSQAFAMNQAKTINLEKTETENE